jgi:hypothetical protein
MSNTTPPELPGGGAITDAMLAAREHFGEATPETMYRATFTLMGTCPAHDLPMPTDDEDQHEIQLMDELLAAIWRYHDLRDPRQVHRSGITLAGVFRALAAMSSMDDGEMTGQGPQARVLIHAVCKILCPG